MVGRRGHFSKSRDVAPIEPAAASGEPMNCDVESSIPDWIIEYPETTDVFNDLKLDASCGGKSLEYVCFQRGFNPQDVLRKLQATVIRSRDA